MKSKVIVILAVLALGLFSCKNKESQEQLDGYHKVEVKEVLQANAYTYLNVTENGKDQWIAVTKMDAKEGETYYYKDFMEMKYFESKDLDRVFESVLFVSDLSSDLNAQEAQSPMGMPPGHANVEAHAGKPEIVKEDVAIEPVEGGITIAELYSNKEKYNGQKVMIKGKITKTNFGIMGKNWYHIQDGTSADGKFDVTITSLTEDVKENDIVTFEGTVAVDKDFGYGYKYEVLIEDAELK